MKKILCFRNSKLGDYLISIPALVLIRKKNPNCKIYYLTSRSKFYKNLPKKLGKKLIIDEFIFYENNFKSIIRLFFKLRSLEIQKFYYLQEKSNLYRELRDFIFFFLINIKKRYGFFTKKKNYKKFSETMQITGRVDKKITKKQIKLFSKISLIKETPLYKFNYITISIGGFSQKKIWEMKNWSILIKLILSNYNFKIVILGTKEDIDSARYLSLIDKKKIFSLCGKTNIEQLLNLIKFSKIHITNDNGSMHISSLFSKKSICLFNNHDPEGKWYPLNDNATILRHKLGINLIKPILVFKKINKILNF